MGVTIEFVIMPSIKAFTFLLMVFLWGLRSGHSQSYDEMKSLNASCSPIDTCSPSRKLEEDNLIEMNCECKSSCARYGTCCLDSPYTRKTQRKQPISTPDLQYSCEWTAGNSSSVFMISKCKQSWQHDYDIKSLCESNVYDYSDPASLVPYTNPESSTTYRNYYCAFCNEDTDESVPWNLKLAFSTRSVQEKYKGEVNQIFEDLVYHSSYLQWGVKVHEKDTSSRFSVHQEKSYPSFVQQENIDPFFIQQEKVNPSFMQQEKIEDVDNDSERFEPIYFSIRYPFHLQNSITNCDANLVDDCSPNWTDKTIQDKCRSFMGTVHATVKASFGFQTTLKFRNVYCAICNFIPDISSIMCRIPGSASGGVGTQNSIDINIRKVPTCRDDEKYSLGRCRITE